MVQHPEHIKDVAAYLKFVLNPRDELSFKRLAQLLPGIGGKGADKLWKEFGKEIGGRRQEIGEPNRLAKALQRCAGIVPKKTVTAWAQLVATIAQLEGEGVRGDASRMISLVVEAGYDDYLKENYANAQFRIDDLEQLAIFARQFLTIEDFLTQLALLTNVEAEDDQPKKDEDEQLRLTTIHQAKGLEFDAVFVIMLCDGLFPSERSVETDEGVEEERRLMYVAITRARNELYLSYPLIRAGYGGGGAMLQQPSRFLGEIPRELVEERNLRAYA